MLFYEAKLPKMTLLAHNHMQKKNYWDNRTAKVLETFEMFFPLTLARARGLMQPPMSFSGMAAEPLGGSR